MRLDQLTADDLAQLGHLLPANAAELVRCVGGQDALALLNGLPGAVIVMPKTAGAGGHRWAQVQRLVSPAAMPLLAAQYGGLPLDIPTCAQLRLEKRNRWVRSRFDALTGGTVGFSKAVAVYELGLELAAHGYAMSSRGIERVLDTPAPTSVAPRRAQINQAQLFD